MGKIETTKYDVQNNSIGTILNWITNGEIGLPELQRPFVWNTVKVRDLIDSLYRGYPIGYIITWNNPDVHLKNGEMGAGKKIIIDGQQRITALRAAIMGEPVITKKFEERRIQISFNPKTEQFQTVNGAIRKDHRWIPDISVLFSEDNMFKFISEFATENGYDPSEVAQPIQHLTNLVNNDIGNIILSSALEIDAVTEIFNRINSKGVELSSADFIMSKLSADTKHDGNNIRKTVEYFSMLLADPTILKNVVANDQEFVASRYYTMIEWAVSERSELYNPRFGDIFHVVLGFEFGRGKHADLISLISGRDFEKKIYTETAMQQTYEKLETGIFQIVNESNFERYLMILKSLGMLTQDTLVLNGMGVLNFGYALYLLLKKDNHRVADNSAVESVVKRWLVMSALTDRYSGSAESQSQRDISKFTEETAETVLTETVSQELSDDFWTVTLPQKLQTSSTRANVWRIFEMAQVKQGSIAWLEQDHNVRDLLTEQGNIHHIFPKAYLKSNGFSQTQYNQIANYTQLTQPRNLQVGDRAPKDYLSDPEVMEFYSAENSEQNAIPNGLKQYDFSNYEEFLEQRRQLMAEKIRAYFNAL